MQAPSEQEVLSAFEKTGSIRAAARLLGVGRVYVENRLRKLEIPQQVVVKPVYRISQDRQATGEKIRVVLIGDAHDSPHLPDKSRFRKIGRYVADIKPDLVIQIGDLASFDSLSRHDSNDTLRGKRKPSFLEDMESLQEALEAFDEGLDGHQVPKHTTLGNHEDRVLSFINRTPEMARFLDENLYTLLAQYDWSFSPFGALHFVGGVAFTHCPLNIMGRPYGGMYAENQIARDSTHDVAYGHSHKGGKKPYPKLGHKKITILNTGCFLPDGHIEEYAKHSLTGWDYGFYDITIQHGHMQLTDWRPMRWLDEVYG